MRVLLCILLVFLLVSCGDSGGSSGSSESNSNMPPTAQDVTIDALLNESVTYDLAPHISDAETTEDSLVVEIVDGPKYNATVGRVAIAGELTEDCPSDNNRTGQIVWNTNTEFYYEVCDGTFYNGGIYFTYRVQDKQGKTSQVRTITINNLADF